MHSIEMRHRAERLHRGGATWSEISTALGVARSTLRAWHVDESAPSAADQCPRCSSGATRPDAYAALLGYYLGDGHLSKHPRYFSLRITCDDRWPGIIADVVDSLRGVRAAGKVYQVHRPGCRDVTSLWKHWPCLFPQHGPGPKHSRAIVLEEWQRAIVTTYPADFVRGLMHSDGSRVRNWATRVVEGERRRYDYPRWQFSNRSADIRDLMCWALDLLEVPWRRSSPVHVSVSRRAAVARLDELIGPKR
ncbi:transcriptional regulator [Nocardioides sp. R-C-SC26]|uniref:transcriptional regulator n=1 Tax=Nocardioides sp. R-C-SC26 TaxID=2870414 RepID=UPI001E399075|nr:transcriptional regulator [Nocardioides sp. R-C-SC26]